MRDRDVDDPATEGGSSIDDAVLPGRRLTVEQLSAGIYGTIVLSAALAGAARLSLVGVVVTALVTVVVYWVAEEYAHALAKRALSGRMTAAGVRRSLRERFTMVEATFLPLLVVAGAGVLGAPVSRAVTAGLVVAAASMAALGAVAARRSGLSVVGTVFAALIATVLGGASVVLKIALH